MPEIGRLQISETQDQTLHYHIPMQGLTQRLFLVY